MLTTKTTPAQTMNDHRTTAHFNAMTKPSETLFDRTPENWPAFEHHLLTEAENLTISWNQYITNYQPTKKSEPFNFLKRYFDLPDNMTNTLMNELADAKIIDLFQPSSQLFKLHCLKTKRKNCLTTDLAHDINASMPIGPSNKDGRIFFIKLVSHTFPDKEAHKRIIYEYTLKLEITESNNMEGFTRELRRHIKQYDAIQGSEWKKITNHIIKQYQKIDPPPFNTGFNMIVVQGPSTTYTKYGWLCILLTERPHQTIGQSLRTMLHGAGLPFKLWPYAFHHYIMLYNLMPHGNRGVPVIRAGATTPPLDSSLGSVPLAPGLSPSTFSATPPRARLKTGAANIVAPTLSKSIRIPSSLRRIPRACSVLSAIAPHTTQPLSLLSSLPLIPHPPKQHRKRAFHISRWHNFAPPSPPCTTLGRARKYRAMRLMATMYCLLPSA
jgi:hypothetical protein